MLTNSQFCTFSSFFLCEKNKTKMLCPSAPVMFVFYLHIQRSLVMEVETNARWRAVPLLLDHQIRMRIWQSCEHSMPRFYHFTWYECCCRAVFVFLPWPSWWVLALDPLTSWSWRKCTRCLPPWSRRDRPRAPAAPPPLAAGTGPRCGCGPSPSPRRF